jgi:hypothetical protein
METKQEYFTQEILEALTEINSFMKAQNTINKANKEMIDMLQAEITYMAKAKEIREKS